MRLIVAGREPSHVCAEPSGCAPRSGGDKPISGRKTVLHGPACRTAEALRGAIARLRGCRTGTHYWRAERPSPISVGPCGVSASATVSVDRRQARRLPRLGGGPHPSTVRWRHRRSVQHGLDGGRRGKAEGSGGARDVPTVRLVGPTRGTGSTSPTRCLPLHLRRLCDRDHSDRRSTLTALSYPAEAEYFRSNAFHQTSTAILTSQKVSPYFEVTEHTIRCSAAGMTAAVTLGRNRALLHV